MVAAQLADTTRADTRVIDDTALHPPIETATFLEDEATTPARGIMVALLLSTPFWALIAFAFYRLL